MTTVGWQPWSEGKGVTQWYDLFKENYRKMYILFCDVIDSCCKEYIVVRSSSSRTGVAVERSRPPSVVLNGSVVCLALDILDTIITISLNQNI